MIPIPDWAPGIHPLVIHFPVALLVSAVAVDLVSLVMGSGRAFRAVGSAMFFAGGLGALAAFLSGRASADGQNIPPLLSTYVSNHADWALYTTVFFGLYGSVRLVAHVLEVRGTKWPRHISARLAFTTVGVLGMFLLFQTGDRGARLVFEHGLGVGPLAAIRTELDSTLALLGAMEQRSADEQFSQTKDGSWSWTPALGAAQVLEEQFDRIPEGGSYPRLLLPQDGGAVFRSDAPVLIYVPNLIGNVSFDADLDLLDFAGVVRLVHHGHSVESYDFLEISGGKMTLGRMRNGTRVEFSAADVPITDSTLLTAVGDGTHFRAYVDGTMVTHGHGGGAEDGWTGLFVDGNGSIVVNRLAATVLP